jgi:hypothetical protein
MLVAENDSFQKIRLVIKRAALMPDGVEKWCVFRQVVPNYGPKKGSQKRNNVIA